MGNTNTRRQKRKEGLRKNNDEEKRTREKERKKRADTARPVKSVRILADGSIGLGHNFKFSRTGLYVMIGIIGAMIFVLGGMSGWYDGMGPDVIQKDKFTPLTFEYCESIDFNDSMCALDYKFCREYADGESICQYAESNPFVNVDLNEKKYTEDEQDFLAPNIITDFIFGWFPPTAHAEERNHFSIGIYKSNSCKALTTTGSDKCPSYQLLSDSFDNTNQAMSGEFVWSDYDNDVYRAAPNFKSHYNFYQYANIPTILAVDPDSKWFSCCMDAQIFIEPSNFVYFDREDLSVDLTLWENDAEQLLIREKIRLLELEKDVVQYQYTDEDDEDLDNDGILDENDDCDTLQEDRNGYEDSDGCPDDVDEDGIKGTSDECPNEKEDFNGYEDGDGCIDDKDQDRIFGNECKESEWIKEYIREHKDDDDAETRQVPVDCFVEKDKCPSEPENYNRFEDDDGCPDLSEHAGELITRKNIYIEGCAFARVAANLTLITQTINYFWNNCEGNSPELVEYTYVPSVPINYADHIWYQYTEWINAKAQECKLKC